MNRIDEVRMIQRALNRWANRASHRLVDTKAGHSICAIEAKIDEHKAAINQLITDQNIMLQSAIAFEDIR